MRVKEYFKASNKKTFSPFFFNQRCILFSPFILTKAFLKQNERNVTKREKECLQNFGVIHFLQHFTYSLLAGEKQSKCLESTKD